MRSFALLLTMLGAAARPVAAQQPAAVQTSAVPQGAFVGVLKSTIDSVPVHLADVRLFFIDSTREINEPLGMKSIETFVDTTRSRIAVSDSTGYFAVWRLAPGRYLMQARRIGFNPIEAFVRLDSETLWQDFRMEPIASILNKVEIHDVSTTRISKRLERVGFLQRKKFNGSSGTFLAPGDFEKYRPQTLRDILSRQGIYERNAEIRFDRMPLDWMDVQDYPAELIAGVEIYRHGRPVDFNMTRRGPNLLSAGGAAFASKYLVVIWTYIP